VCIRTATVPLLQINKTECRLKHPNKQSIFLPDHPSNTKDINNTSSYVKNHEISLVGMRNIYMIRPEKCKHLKPKKKIQFIYWGMLAKTCKT
jgi:hypothetical protein